MTFPLAPVIRPAGSGETYPGPAVHTIKLAAGDTGGLLCIEEFTCPPGFTGPPPHVHHAHDESFVMLGGSLRFIVDGQAHDAPQGTVVYAPRETAHAFSNPHDTPATVLGVYTPAGYEQYFADLAAAISADTLNHDSLAQILAKYHTDVVD